MMRGEVALAMLDGSPDGLMIVDADGLVMYANNAITELFGYPHDELISMPVEALMPSDMRERHVANREEYIKDPVPRPMESGLELSALRRDGSYFLVEISLSPTEIDGQPVVIAAVRDVSQRRATAKRVALLIERERIARDLHDMVIQRILAAGLSLEAVAGLAEPRVVRDRIDGVVDALDATIRELRNAIFQLGINDLGQSLSGHLASVVNERTEQLGFEPTLSLGAGIDDLRDSVGEQLVAAVIESLSNVARHADATEVHITAGVDDGELMLSVVDNGVGISGVPKPSGGVSNIVWRATELGGTCVVESNRPSGTAITWRVPV